ncbi:mRNA 3' end processing factor [Rhodotorula kratochvilovae]
MGGKRAHSLETEHRHSQQRVTVSWYPPPQDPYAAYGYPAAPPPAQPYYGYQPPPPPPAPAYPQPGPAYGRYDYAAYAGYAQPPPPPPPPAPAPYYAHQQHHSPPPQQPVAQSPPPQQELPLKEGELRPPPDVGVDPNSFRRYFAQQLQGLTFNHKPIITALTLFANEHLVRMGGVVAQCLEEHLRTCPPQYLLPSFYLLDSISKNIGAPYLALFARFLERAFLSAYHAADPSTRTKLEELLGTWKTGGPDGGELFRTADEPREGGRVQRGIESALFGARGRGDGIGGRAVKDAEMYNAGVQQLPHTATSTERSGVLYDVRRLLALRTETATSDPADANNQSQIGALKKLESLILNTQLTTGQVNQIRAQLKALTPAPAPPPPAPAPVPAPAPLPAALATPAFTPAASLTPQLAPAAPVAPAAAAPNPLMGGIDLSLLSQLSASGALANLFAPALAAEVKPEIKPDVGTGEGDASASAKDEMALAWEEEILRLNVGLSNAEVAAPRPHAPTHLYLPLSLSCAQCALRLFPTAVGKKKMDAHLDWHFKHKRRIREAQGRTAGRGWFTEEEAWYSSDETTGEVAPSAGFTTSSASDPSAPSSTAAAKAAAVDRAALRALKVPVPAGEGGAALGERPCPVCQDKLKSEWSDDEEEWVWWNAVVVDGVLYHATCHAEASVSLSRASASASVAGTGARPSREGTPASIASRKRPAPLSPGEGDAVKRELDAGADEAQGEPELKRVKAEPGTEGEAA